MTWISADEKSFKGRSTWLKKIKLIKQSIGNVCWKVACTNSSFEQYVLIFIKDASKAPKLVTRIILNLSYMINDICKWTKTPSNTRRLWFQIEQKVLFKAEGVTVDVKRKKSVCKYKYKYKYKYKKYWNKYNFHPSSSMSHWQCVEGWRQRE